MNILKCYLDVLKFTTIAISAYILFIDANSNEHILTRANSASYIPVGVVQQNSPTPTKLSRDTTAKNEPLQKWRGHTANITSVAVSRDGKYVASTSADKTVMIWDIATGKEVNRLVAHTRSVIAADFSHNSAKIITVSEDDTVRIWDVVTGKVVFEKQYVDLVPSVSFGPDDTSYLIAMKDSLVFAQAQTGKLIRVFEGMPYSISQLTFNNSGTLVAAIGIRNGGGATGSLVVWDTNTGQRAFSLPLENEQPQHIAFSPNGKMLIITNNTGMLRLLDTQSWFIIRVLQIIGAANATFSPDSTLLAVTTPNLLAIYNTNGQLQQRTSKVKNPQSVQFLSVGGLLITNTSESVYLWNIAAIPLYSADKLRGVWVNGPPIDLDIGWLASDEDTARYVITFYDENSNLIEACQYMNAAQLAQPRRLERRQIYIEYSIMDMLTNQLISSNKIYGTVPPKCGENERFDELEYTKQVFGSPPPSSAIRSELITKLQGWPGLLTTKP